MQQRKAAHVNAASPPLPSNTVPVPTRWVTTAPMSAAGKNRRARPGRRPSPHFPGALRLRGVPSGSEHALSPDEADVLALADTTADPQVHLGAHRALAHGLPRGPLSSGHQRDGYGAAKSGAVLTLSGLSQGKVRVPSGSNRRNRT